MKRVLGKLPRVKLPPSPNSNANLKPNPDPDQGQFSGHQEMLRKKLVKVKLKLVSSDLQKSR